MTSRTLEAVSVALVGSGGAGVMTAGNMLLEAGAAAGFYALMTRSSGPQIRGGEAAALLRFASLPVQSHGDAFDLLVAVDWENVQRFAAEIPLTPASLIIADPAAGEIPPAIAKSGATVREIPLKDMAKKIPGGRPNMVALGAVATLLGLPLPILETAVASSLSDKPEAQIASKTALHAGAEAAARLELDRKPQMALPAAMPDGRWAITGNQAAGLGAIKGGIRFVAAYPITPATEMLEWMTPALDALGGKLLQAEDELASINMIIGASFGGVPSLTATSGPGLSLMLESFGLAIASETPIVVVDVMRGGPSTGIPTKTEQSDLNVALYGTHGDAPHLVLAPTSIADCLFTTQWAVHLAEGLQTPTIILSDQFLGQARVVIDRPAEAGFKAERAIVRERTDGYARYALTPDGVSPMALPGTPGCQYTADGLEHNPRGTPSSQVQDHLSQLDKRRDKLARHDYGDHWGEVEGEGEIAVITWGSITQPAREALARMRAGGVKVRLVAIRLLSPPQPERLAAALKGVRRALVVEQSHSAQFHRYLRAHYDLPLEIRPFHRPGPLLFRPCEIEEALASWT